jgi:hypothetical protein
MTCFFEEEAITPIVTTTGCVVALPTPRADSSLIGFPRLETIGRA